MLYDLSPVWYFYFQRVHMPAVTHAFREILEVDIPRC